jgi:hypothetical protein
MFSRITFALALVTLFVASSHAQSVSGRDLPVVVPLHKMRAGQWVEKVWGDPEKPGEVFAIRIHNDAGYLVMPHVHPMDEPSVPFKAPGGLAWEGVSNVRP